MNLIQAISFHDYIQFNFWPHLHIPPCKSIFCLIGNVLKTIFGVRQWWWYQWFWNVDSERDNCDILFPAFRNIFLIMTLWNIFRETLQNTWQLIGFENPWHISWKMKFENTHLTTASLHIPLLFRLTNLFHVTYRYFVYTLIEIDYPKASLKLTTVT